MMDRLQDILNTQGTRYEYTIFFVLMDASSDLAIIIPIITPLITSYPSPTPIITSYRYSSLPASHY